jgi:hypothetical protein
MIQPLIDEYLYTILGGDIEKEIMGKDVNYPSLIRSKL